MFRAYTAPDTLRFTRTRSTIGLGQLGAALMSRSEARRVVQRLTEFTHAVLDFSGVDIVGQVAGRSIGVLECLEGTIHPFVLHEAFAPLAGLVTSRRVRGTRRITSAT